MKHRSLVPERMDDPKLPEHEHKLALKGLRRLNAWTANASLAWKYIRTVAGPPSNCKATSILDIATGSADIPIALKHLSVNAGVDLAISACDISPLALKIGRGNAHDQNVPIRFFEHDIISEDITGEFDLVMCSQFLHHLTEEDAIDVLRRMRSAAKRRVIVIDLVRSRLNLFQVWFATRMLSRSRVVHFDGPQSIRAAFTMDEFESLVVKAGFRNYQLTAKWPCRFVFCGEADGAE